MRAPSRWFAVCALLAALALACRDEDLDPAPTPRPRAGTETAASPTSPPAAVTPKAPVNLPASPERVPPRTRTPEPADPSVLREPAPFPTDLAVVVATWSCWQCEGGPTSIVRIYRDPQGELRTETLLAMRGGRRLGANYLWRVIADNRSGIAVSECLGPECLATFSGVSYSQPGRSVEVRRSVDGGVTWSAEPVEPGKGGLLALFAGGEVVLWEATPRGLSAIHDAVFSAPVGARADPTE